MQAVWIGSLVAKSHTARHATRFGFSSMLNNDDSLFFVAWGLWLAGHVLQQTTIFLDSSTLGLKCVYFLAIILGVAYEFRRMPRYGASAVGAGAVLLCFALPIFEGVSSIFIQGLFFVFIGRDIPFKKIALFTLRVLIVEIAAIVLLSILGVIESVSVIEKTGRERTSLGFTWYSRLPNFLLTIILLYIYCKGKSGRIAAMLVFFVLTIAVYMITGSRNPFIFSVLALAMWVFLRRGIEPSKRIQMVILVPLFFVCAIAICWLGLTYDSSVSWMRAINDATSNRLLYSGNAFRTEMPSLFGTDAFSSPVINYSVGYLDSSYQQLVLSFGLIPACIILGAFTVLMKQSIENGTDALTLCLVVIALHSVLEWELTWIIYTPFLFLLFRPSTKKRRFSPMSQIAKYEHQT